MKIRFQIILVFLIIFAGLAIDDNVNAQNQKTSEMEPPIRIELTRENFATMTNKLQKGNRIGYRFHEHKPIAYGTVPLSDRQANIDIDEINKLEADYRKAENVFVFTQNINKDADWSKQDWTFYMKPVNDGVEILLTVETYNEGLPAYYGIQQCFRLGGATNKEWRRTIADTPAFSEFDLWNRQTADSEKQSLTYIMRNHNWEVLPADEKTLGARTPAGVSIDFLRTNGNPMSEVGPYQAFMLAPIDFGLITRMDQSKTWVCGIYWQNTTHVTNHHPADCLHSIVNVGNVPPFSKRAITGKIYWFKGNLDSLAYHYKRDFSGEKINKKLTVASCQFPVSADVSENAGWIKKQMRMAKIQGAELAHFPECALSGYGGADVEDFNKFDWQLLKKETGSILELAKALKLWVLLGSSHQLGDGNKPHNSLYVINPDGNIIDRYDKRFCTKGDLKYYSPGDHFVTFDIHNIKCGLLICYDLRFPELYREYRKLGADVIFQSFYNARHRENCIHPKIMPVTAQARAATNSFFMSLTNSSAPYSWPCYFITPDGLVEQKLKANGDGILISTINMDKKYYDPSKDFRMDAINGKLNSGDTVQDPLSEDRTVY